MSLNKGKHNVGEVDGVRCTIVETGITRERAAFLKELLQFNGYEVKIQEEVSDPPAVQKTFTIGVTDIIFNPRIHPCKICYLSSIKKHSKTCSSP